MWNRLANLAKTVAICALMPAGISAAAQFVTTGPAQAQHMTCEDYARAEADRRSGTVRSAGKGALVGGIIGGGDGAVRGAAIGAVRGVLGGEGRRWNRYYDQAYDRCVRSR